MGIKGDALAVVGADLKVHGLRGEWASILLDEIRLESSMLFDYAQCYSANTSRTPCGGLLSHAQDPWRANRSPHSDDSGEGSGHHTSQRVSLDYFGALHGAVSEGGGISQTSVCHLFYILLRIFCEPVTATEVLGPHSSILDSNGICDIVDKLGAAVQRLAFTLFSTFPSIYLFLRT